MAMANILQSLGDAIERQQQRKHENNMEVLRAIYTRPGMIVLGVRTFCGACVDSQLVHRSDRELLKDRRIRSSE